MPDQLAGAGFTIGANPAATLGKLVLRDVLMELIQYAHAMASLGAEPALLVPGWLMKYYILD
jgi:polyhydroxyalkanoate synthase subunit PhaC